MYEELHTYLYQKWGIFFIGAYALNGEFGGPSHNSFESEAQEYGRRK